MNNTFEKLKQSYKTFKENNKSLKSKIPTILTSIRLLAPVTVAPLILTGNIIPGLIMASAFAFTDALDGFFARKLNAESDFGRLLDPIVDKVFLTTLILCGASINPILLINIAPEIAIAINNSKAFNENKNVYSSIMGKIKTWILSLDVLINLFPYLNPSIKSGACYLTFAFQSITYISYKKTNKQTAIINRTYNDLSDNAEPEKNYTKRSLRREEIELLKYKKSLIENNRHRIMEEKQKQKILKK